MESKLKRLIAAALTLGALANMHFTVAMESKFSPLEKLPAISSESTIDSIPPEEIDRYLESKITELERTAPGIFFVDSDFKDPQKADPYQAYKILDQIIKIFSMFPHITQKFIEMIQLTDEKKFEVKILNAENSKTFQLGIEQNGYPPAGHYISTKKSIQLLISADTEIITKNSYPVNRTALQTGADPARYLASHEMGHLISSVIKYLENKEMFLKFLIVNQITLELIENLENEDKMMEIMLKLSSYPDVAEWLKEIPLRIKSDAIKRAGVKVSFLSICGCRNDEEWLAEGVANALLNFELNKLSVSTRELLTELDAKLGMKK